MPDAHVREQFDDGPQQAEASRFGMWVFLMSEILFFGGLFTAYITYRVEHPLAFQIGSNHLDYWLGTINTALLLASSLTMALAVHGAQEGRQRRISIFLVLTLILGLLFLGVKFYEYAKHYSEGLFPGFHFTYTGSHAAGVYQFMSFYFVMTGMHAVHMTVGVFLLMVMLLMSMAGKFTRAWHTPIVITGLYWHFVDIVWIFLYPCFYLAGHR